MYLEDLSTASRGNWRAKMGSDELPPPEFRYVDASMRLGRDVDAYGAQAKMR
jgi:hypothetical protein